ncbi:MAG: histidine kinase [bacterium]
MLVSHSGTVVRPRTRLQGVMLWRAIVAGLVAIFLIRLAYYTLRDVSAGMAVHFPMRLFEEVTGAVLAAVPVAALVWLVRRVPFARDEWSPVAFVYTASFVIFTMVHTAAMITVRAALAPVFGFSGYAYGFHAARFGYEAANDLIPFVAIVALLQLADSLLAYRERERHADELERTLLRAELSNLRLQLQPHFLFNALNTISATMYEDVAAADVQLGQLAELLRTSLRTTHAHEVPLRDELHLLAQYLELMRARFGESLRIVVDANPDIGDLLVPSMVLQPLVENAVRHGGISRIGRGCVVIAIGLDVASTPSPVLVLRVHDDGPPGKNSGDPVVGGGTGLSATARRLRLLYGDAQSLHAGPAPDGGFDAVVRIPARVERSLTDGSEVGRSGDGTAAAMGRDATRVLSHGWT